VTGTSLAIPFAFAAAATLSLAGYTTTEQRSDPSMQNALDTMNAAAPDTYAAAAAVAEEAFAEEFAEVARNCELTGAALVRDGGRYRLALPPTIYAARDRAPADGRIACVRHWGLEIGHDFEIVEARP
jgi:hypothetical protein